MTTESVTDPWAFWNVLLVDIVDYSELPDDQQVKSIRDLIAAIRDSAVVTRLGAGAILAQAGDSVVVAIESGSPEDVCMLARQIHERYGARRSSLRIGINSGSGFEVTDVNGQRNIAGSCVNLAQRVASCGLGGHIMVSEDSARLLHAKTGSWRQTLGRPYEYIVKHGRKLMAYSYVDGDRWGNVNEPRDDAARYRLGDRTIRSGVTDLFVNREEAAREIVTRMSQVSRRAWLLGITLTEHFRVNDVRASLISLVAQRKDVRILLLDALRSPGIFRAFVESPIDQIERVLRFPRGAIAERAGPRVPDPLLQQPLYNGFTGVVNSLESSEPLHGTVRFYGHMPICWLVILDDIAYYMPYTVSPVGNRDHWAMDGYTPVLKIDRRENARLFGVVRGHFETFWATSDVDLFHIGTEKRSENEAVQRTFKVRGPWLRRVHKVLEKQRTWDADGVVSVFDRRVFPRQDCRWKKGLVSLRWGTAEEARAEILDYSREGLGLRRRTGTLPKLDTTVRVVRIGQPPKALRVAADILDGLIKRSGGAFRVVELVGDRISLRFERPSAAWQARYESIVALDRERGAAGPS